jgi:predicted Zn-dependent peptidase
MQKIQTLTLSNNLNIILIPNKKLDLVMSTVNVAVGSNIETQKTLGISHLLEHQLFHNKFEGMDITKYLHKISAHFNAATSYDQTNYYIISNTEDICQSIDMLYNIFVNSTFTDDDIIKEKRIVMEEYGITYSNIQQLLVKLLAVTKTKLT